MIGTNVRNQREAKNMTQVELAEAIGAIQGTISGIETGVRNPSIDMLVRLAAALECGVEDLVRTPSSNNGNGVAQDDSAAFGSVLR